MQHVITSQLSKDFWAKRLPCWKLQLNPNHWLVHRKAIPAKSPRLIVFAGILPFHWLDAHDGRIAQWLLFHLSVFSMNLQHDKLAPIWLFHAVLHANEYTWLSAKEVSLIVELRPCPSNQAMDNEHSCNFSQGNALPLRCRLRQSQQRLRQTADYGHTNAQTSSLATCRESVSCGGLSLPSTRSSPSTQSLKCRAHQFFHLRWP